MPLKDRYPRVSGKDISLLPISLTLKVESESAHDMVSASDHAALGNDRSYAEGNSKRDLGVAKGAVVPRSESTPTRIFEKTEDRN